MTSYRLPYPVPGVIWASLPLPTLLIDAQARILEVNPAAETFLNTSDKALRGQPAFDRLSIDAPMEEALSRARANRAPGGGPAATGWSGRREQGAVALHEGLESVDVAVDVRRGDGQREHGETTPRDVDAGFQHVEEEQVADARIVVNDQNFVSAGSGGGLCHVPFRNL